MIHGIGTDIVEIDRIRKAVQRWEGDFLNKIFTEKEISFCFKRKDPFPGLSARFAAKEAVIKASGVRLSFKDIEVVNEPSGKPSIRIEGDRKAFFEERVITHLSLSHEQHYAIAMVVLETK